MDRRSPPPEAGSSATPALDDRTLTRRPGDDGPSSPSSSSFDGGRFAPGEIVDARYRVVSLLGRGGMGEVYRAEDLRLGEVVALKFLPDRLAHDATALARLHEEVRTARRISHVNAVRVHDIGEAEGQPFLTMEYVDGEDLASLLRRIGALPVGKGVELARQMCAGLAAAHARGIVHRDLKPANVMVDGEGRAKINDFGLATASDDLGRDRAGTPAYMAPEQLEGGAASMASDVYSLGLTLYEMFTGERLDPQASAPAEELAETDEDAARDPGLAAHERLREIDEQVAQAIAGCLQRDPRARSSALDVVRRLPGGDPLAAALAAGETPSPQMVAGAAVEGAISKVLGAVLLGATLVGLAVTIWNEGRISIYTHDVPLERQVLVHRARTLLEQAGVDEGTYDYSQFRPSDLAPVLSQERRELEEWSRLGSSRPGLTEFVYRTTPRPVWSGTPIQVRPRWGTPLRTPGEARLRLDSQGRLLELAVLPPPTLESTTAAVPDAGTQDVETETVRDLQAWFESSGLDSDLFEITPPVSAPPFYADRVISWAGRYQADEALDPSQIVRVDAALRGGDVVWWRVTDNRSTAPVTFVDRVELVLVVILLMLGLGGWAAWRHHRSGRGDHRGATVIAAAVGATTLWNVLLTDLPVLLSSFAALFATLGLTALVALIGWLSYMALEPYLRRLTPKSQVSWSRLLNGQFRDPLLGRDFLIGLAFPCVFYAVGAATMSVDPNGFPLRWAYPHGATNLDGALSSIGNLTHITNVLAPLGLMFLLVLPRVVLPWRRIEPITTALGYLLLVGFFLAWNGPNLGNLVASVVLVLLARVGGLVALFGFALAPPQLFLVPTSLDPSTWWAPYSWIGAAYLTALALLAFRLATQPAASRVPAGAVSTPSSA